jgi:hypothetical protein
MWLLVPVLFTGCIKDHCTKTYTIYTPVYKTSAEVRANIRSNAPREIAKPGKIYIKGSYIFLNEIDKGIHVIDNSNPSSPRNLAFIDIPGNLDLAVKGNTLYADLYSDFVTLDISDPLNVQVKKIMDDQFPFRRYSSGFMADTSKVIVDWIVRDTTVDMDCNGGGFNPWSSCSSCFFAVADASRVGGVSPIGMGGSMARFAIVNNVLYTVSDADLKVFDIANANNPTLNNSQNIGWNIETIYPLKDKLFIGSNVGMSIFSIANPFQPVKQGNFAHAFACDPVVADDDFAYVTLRTDNNCRQAQNLLDIVDITNVMSPTLRKSYSMTNPHGLSIDGSTLFLCDGKDGLKLYDVTNRNNIKLFKHIEGMQAYDVIAYNGIALLVAKDGLYQYDYYNLNEIKLLSRIGLKNQ